MPRPSYHPTSYESRSYVWLNECVHGVKHTQHTTWYTNATSTTTPYVWYLGLTSRSRPCSPDTFVQYVCNDGHTHKCLPQISNVKSDPLLEYMCIEIQQRPGQVTKRVCLLYRTRLTWLRNWNPCLPNIMFATPCRPYCRLAHPWELAGHVLQIVHPGLLQILTLGDIVHAYSGDGIWGLVVPQSSSNLDSTRQVSSSRQQSSTKLFPTTGRVWWSGQRIYTSREHTVDYREIEQCKTKGSINYVVFLPLWSTYSV